MLSFAKRFVADETGATTIEYGLIVTLIAVGIITAANSLGAQITTPFNSAASR